MNNCLSNNIKAIFALCIILLLATLTVDSSAGCEFEWVSEGKPVFGVEGWPQVYVSSSCSAAEIEGRCGSNCDDWECEELWSFSAELPEEYLAASPDCYWGNQGPCVVVTGCDGIIPATGSVKGSDSDNVPKSFWVDCSCGPFTLTVARPRTNSYYYMAEFDPEVFIVRGTPVPNLPPDEKPKKVLISSLYISLVDDSCETLKKALGSKVTITAQAFRQKWVNATCPDETCEAKPYASELGGESSVCDVTVKFIPSDLLESKCGDSGKPKKRPASEQSINTSCSSCSGDSGDSGLGNISVGGASAGFGFAEDGTVSMFGSPGFTYAGDGKIAGVGAVPEINAPGGWLRALHYPYQANKPIYTTQITGDAITSVCYAFSVQVYEQNMYHYEYELTGNWEDEHEDPDDPTSPVIKSKEDSAFEAFVEGANGNVRLTHVTNPAGDTILEFLYDSAGNVTKQISYDENENPNGIIRYGYGAEGSLTRVWAGTDESKYVAPGSGDPTGGRWIDVSYNPAGINNKPFLERISYGGCTNCRAPRRYGYGGPQGNQLIEIRKDDGTVLASYDYDYRGRYKSYTIGDGDNELKVNEWLHSDYDPARPETSGDNMLVRKDYVDNAYYRAKVFFASDNGSLTKEIHYHQLQENSEPLDGPYSVYKYYYISDPVEGRGYVTEYPKGNKLIKYQDDKGNVLKTQWSDSSTPENQYEYYHVYYGDQSSDPNMYHTLIKNEINAYGGVTNYVYDQSSDSMNLLMRTEPVPGQGVTGGTQERQVTNYVYDAQDRVDYEYTKDSTGGLVYTKNVYDSFGNIKRTHENCTDYTSADPQTGLKTTYDYNEYNDLIKTTYPSGKVERKFYSDSGTVIADAVYKEDATSTAVSATIYLYEDGKISHKKTAKMNAPFTFTDTIAQAEGEGFGITWVQESYEYDEYGRRKAIVADSGPGGKALRTEYEYNNQNEVIKVTEPDGRYTKTIRDGRGLVSQIITGVRINEQDNDKATTSYFYDLNGNLVKKVDPESYTELYQYDTKDRMIRVRHGK